MHLTAALSLADQLTVERAVVVFFFNYQAAVTLKKTNKTKNMYLYNHVCSEEIILMAADLGLQIPFNKTV